MASRDEGYQKLQHTVDSAQQVLPNTSSQGKEVIREDLARLEKTWDDLQSTMNDGKSAMDTALAQWEVYEDSTDKLTKWLQSTENSVKAEMSLQDTLQEKRAQHERVKVCDFFRTYQIFIKCYQF